MRVEKPPEEVQWLVHCTVTDEIFRPEDETSYVNNNF